MTTTAIIFMLFSWVAVLGLAGWSFYKIIRGSKQSGD